MPKHPIAELDALIQFATVPKQQKTVKFTFATPFKKPPVVILTPYYKEQNTQVALECVTEVTTTDCLITSNNGSAGATNYFVNLLAVDPGLGGFDNLPMAAGSVAKTKNILTINLPNGRLTAPDPAMLLTLYWKGSVNPPGAVETLVSSTASECKAISTSFAPSNFFVNYLACDLGCGNVGNRSVQTGIVNKTNAGVMRVYFQKTFDTVPTVFLTPWLDTSAGGVGYVDTISTVEKEYFEYVSSNYGANFFVNWLAIA